MNLGNSRVDFGARSIIARQHREAARHRALVPTILVLFALLLIIKPTLTKSLAVQGHVGRPGERSLATRLRGDKHESEVVWMSAVSKQQATSGPARSLTLESTQDTNEQIESTTETIFGDKRDAATLGGELGGNGSPELGHCSISFATRRRIARTSSVPATKYKDEEVVERTLVCSRLEASSFQDMERTIRSTANYSVQQIQIVSSEPAFVLNAVDLICHRLDCSTLTVFNVSNHEISDINQLPAKLASWSRLEIVDLSSTSLQTIRTLLPVDSTNKLGIIRSLTHLHLDGNKMGELDFNLILKHMPNLRHLSLVNNNIFHIHCAESLQPLLARQFDYINLAGNVISCNKTTQMWFLKQLASPATSSIFADSDKIRCTLSSLNEMTWSQRISVLETDICDICDCHSAKKTALQVDCRNKSLTKLPDVLPMNTRILNLTMNHITSLGVPENAKNWENVTYVHLEDNLISSFQQLELNSKFIRNLVALDIRRNKFQEFPSHIFEQFVNLDQVHLSDNPWLCDCESTFAFQEWLQRQFHKVGDKEEIRCGMSGQDINGLRSNGLEQRLSSRVIYKLSKSELCPQGTLERPVDWLDLVNVTLGLTILLILAKVVMDYIYQHRTKRLPHFFRLNF